MLRGLPTASSRGEVSMARNHLQFDISDEQQRTLELEIQRLKSRGLRANRAQVIRILIEQHRLKLRLASEQDDAAGMLAWLWRKRHDDEKD